MRTFLAMARQQRPERGPVAINDVVAAALDITGYAMRTSSIDVTLDLARDIPLDRSPTPTSCTRCCSTSIINAQQALQDQPPPRRIRVTSRFDPARDAVRITVADNGPGIPPQLRARIFEPYFTTKPTGIGSGVGLAVSLGIVEAHGGTLTVDCPAEAAARCSPSCCRWAPSMATRREAEPSPVTAPARRADTRSSTTRRRSARRWRRSWRRAAIAW